MLVMPDALVTQATIPEQQVYAQFNARTFPIVLSPVSSSPLPNSKYPQNTTKPPTFATAADAVAWAAGAKDDLRAMLEAEGAILFRGFPLENPEAFSDFVEALGVKPLPYVGGAAPRFTVYKDVHTTNESPLDQLIPFHHEMAQVPKYPKTIFFFCDGEPKEGGETPLCPSDIAFARLQKEMPEFCKEIEEKGVIYTRVIPKEDDPTSPIGRGWVSTYGTSDKDKAIEIAKNLGVSLEWLPNGDVKTVSSVLPAVKSHHKTQRKVWFNSVVAAYVGWQDSRNDRTKAVTLGDGTPINPEAIERMQKIMAETRVAVPWHKGDVYWIDNDQVLHSRNTFVPPRRILAYLGLN